MAVETRSLTPLLDRRYTAAELERFPCGEGHYELVRGELLPMAPTGDEHGSFTHDLAFEVSAFVRANNLGRGYAAETGFLVERDPDTVLAPDFAFVARERLTGPRQRGFVPLAPDLVLETRSPGDTRCEVAAKVRRWLDAGVRLIWELDPHRQALTVYASGSEVVVLGPQDTLTGGEVLPGFTLLLSRLFSEAEGAGS